MRGEQGGDNKSRKGAGGGGEAVNIVGKELKRVENEDVIRGKN